MRHSDSRSAITCSMSLAFLAFVGCQQKMAGQPSYRPLDPPKFFADGRSARPQVSGTVARGHLRTNLALYTGRKTRSGSLREEQEPAPQPGTDRARRFDENRDFVDRFPIAIDESVVRPVISEGYGSMPSYAGQIPAEDRWAIVAYLRSLQLSQHFSASGLTPEMRQGLTAANAAASTAESP
jgi:hypothetical protein